MNLPPIMIMSIVFCMASATASTAQERKTAEDASARQDRSVHEAEQPQTPALKELSELQLHQQAWYQETFLKNHALAIAYYKELMRRSKNRFYVQQSKRRLITLYLITGQLHELKEHMRSYVERRKNEKPSLPGWAKRIVEAVDEVIASQRFEKLSKEAREAYRDPAASPERRRQARQRLWELVREVPWPYGFNRRGPDRNNSSHNVERAKLLSKKRELESLLRKEQAAGRGKSERAKKAIAQLRTLREQLRKLDSRRGGRDAWNARYVRSMLGLVHSLQREYKKQGKQKEAADLKTLETKVNQLLRKGKPDDASRLIREAGKKHPALRSRRGRRGRRRGGNRPPH